MVELLPTVMLLAQTIRVLGRKTIIIIKEFEVNNKHIELMSSSKYMLPEDDRLEKPSSGCHGYKVLATSFLLTSLCDYRRQTLSLVI